MFFIATLSALPPEKPGQRGPEHVQHAPAVSRERSDEAVAFSTTPGPFRARRLRSGLATHGPEAHAGARGPTPRGRRARAVAAAALRAEGLTSQRQGRPRGQGNNCSDRPCTPADEGRSMESLSLHLAAARRSTGPWSREHASECRARPLSRSVRRDHGRVGGRFLCARELATFRHAL